MDNINVVCYKNEMKKVIFICIFAISVIGVFVLFQSRLIKQLDSIASNPNPLVRHFAPTWRSVKKIIDIPYLIYGSFTRSALPVYEIITTRNDRINLLENLPDYPRESRLHETQKNTVKATFRHGSYSTDDAKIRYRGKSPEHWAALQKSWQVNLPKDAPLGDRTTLRFFVPNDKGYARALLWNHLSEKLGFLAPKAHFGRLRVNSRDGGIYVLLEGWEESFFENRERVPYHLFAEFDIPIDKNNHAKNDLLRPEGLSRWQERLSERTGESFPELAYLIFLSAHATDEEFNKAIFTILDKELFFRWMMGSMLAGNFRQGNLENLNFYFDPATGKFEPIFFDPGLERVGDNITIAQNRLVNRVLRNGKIKKEFETMLEAYVTNNQNLTDDLAFYDEATRALLPEIYRDSTKLPTSFEVTRIIETERAIYRDNMLTLRSMLASGGLVLRYAEEYYPLSDSLTSRDDRFTSFRKIYASRKEFLAEYPQFVASAHPQTVILLPGTHAFSRDVIVPRGLRLIIRENATLLFAPNISLVSYSPITARGDSEAPIVVRPLLANQSWGVLAVINAPQKSAFSHVLLSGGKDATINGVYFSGMLSAHNADLEFRRGIIEYAGADDGIHVLSGQAIIADSFFRDNSSDGIDVDFAKDESLFERNLFTTTGGDAMDLSFSKITVRENTVRECGDKGISVGEASTPHIENNTIKNCVYGIAVKDRSEAIIMNNILGGNKTAIGLYRKKPHFISGGSALLINNQFIENQTNVSTDTYSRYSEQP